MSQKRVAVVLASLVGTMTFSAAVLLLMEGGALGTAVPGRAVDRLGSQPAGMGALQAQDYKFIMIYESGDLAASAASLAEGPRTGGSIPTTVRPKANFHFVIHSAQSGAGTVDGHVDSTGWNLQIPGAPQAGWTPDTRNHIPYYSQTIGVCLAAELDRKTLSNAQFGALLRLVKDLQQHHGIQGVMFQWEVDGHQGTPAQQQFARVLRSAL